MIDVQSRPRRNEQVLARMGEQDLLLLSPRSGQYYTLDEVGARVWELCDGTRTVREMGALIGAEYDAPAAQIEADLVELLTDLAHEQLVSAAG